MAFVEKNRSICQYVQVHSKVLSLLSTTWLQKYYTMRQYTRSNFVSSPSEMPPPGEHLLREVDASYTNLMKERGSS